MVQGGPYETGLPSRNRSARFAWDWLTVHLTTSKVLVQPLFVTLTTGIGKAVQAQLRPERPDWRPVLQCLSPCTHNLLAMLQEACLLLAACLVHPDPLVHFAALRVRGSGEWGPRWQGLSGQSRLLVVDLLRLG